ncbi:MAG: isoprenylcysteine carboxylmethyltransferase family protein [Oscillospiraceae bacterium]|nr:isoprenylcysteine carboxylmethyltransferase family protein [Oscillospiraceae bacterium]
MSFKLFCSAILKFLLGVVLVGVLVFLPAGSFDFFGGWLFMGVLFLPMFIAGIVMMIKSPELLKSRLNAKEKRGEQSLVVKLSGLMFILGFVLAGLDYRFSWLVIPKYVQYSALAVFLVGYLLYAEVLRENQYLSRTIEVKEGQKVVETGLYGVVRHPMYTATLLMFLAMPLILGSAIAVLVFLAYPILIIARLKNEEELLEEELSGYKEYKLKVKYRLIPYIW